MRHCAFGAALLLLGTSNAPCENLPSTGMIAADRQIGTVNYFDVSYQFAGIYVYIKNPHHLD
jgi:hypothetical protein